MKRTLLCLLILQAIHAQITVAQNTRIDLSVSGVPEGTTFSIALGATHRQEPIIQTATLKDGKLYFAFDSEGIRLYDITTPAPFGLIQVMASRGDHVQVNAVGSKDVTPHGEFYVFKPVQVRGSFSHSDLEQKLAIRDQLNATYEQYHKKHKEVVDKLTTLKPQTPEMDELFQSDAYKSFAADEKTFFETVKNTYDQLYLGNKSSWWGPFLVLHTMNYLPKEMKEVYDQFTPEAKNSFYGKVMARQLTTEPWMGHKLEDFTFVDQATGQESSLYAQLAGKRFLLLDIWASWCGPCRREIPNFKAAYEKYHDRGFDIVSISADEDEQAWLKALQEEQLPWANGLDRGQKICRQYDVHYFPTVYVVDSNGVVIAKDGDARGENLQQLLEKLFNE